MIINAGSENKGGTLKQAIIIAEQWLKNIHEEGFKEVQMEYVGRLSDGDWQFKFTHTITKRSVTLETHGFTEREIAKFIFWPRIYWNGSSTGTPEISDWLVDGFNYRIEFYRSEK